MTRAELWTVGLTGILAFTGIIGNYLAVRAVGDAREAARTDQRAWVGMAAGDTTGIRAGIVPTFTVQIANTGKTPALNCITTTQWMISDSRVHYALSAYLATALAARLAEKGKSFGGGVLQPGAKEPSMLTVKPAITDKQMDDLNSGRMVFRIYGMTSYDDIFKQHHETTFCIRYLPQEGADFAHCDEFNGAD